MTPSSAHSFNVRICHWINVVACAYLLWSGIHIFLDISAGIVALPFDVADLCLQVTDLLLQGTDLRLLSVC